MSLRSLVVFLIALAVSTGAPVVWAEEVEIPTPQDEQTGSAQAVEQPAGEAIVVCEPEARPATLATWWANSTLGRFCRSVARDTMRTNYWPKPFNRADRQAVRMPMVQMVANGWKRQNTLGDHHFDRATGKLNQAGKQRVRQILLEGLPQHRDIYVYRAERLTETEARVDAVQQYAAQTVRDGQLPAVFETDLPAPGTPAQRVDLVDSKFQEAMPSPALPASSSANETD